MKRSLLAILCSLPPIFSSCQLSSEKAATEAEGTAVGQGAIPPPSSQQSLEEETLGGQETGLPDLTENNSSGEISTPENESTNVVQSGDFVFRDPVQNLPSERELAMPPSPFTPPPASPPAETSDVPSAFNPFNTNP